MDHALPTAQVCAVPVSTSEEAEEARPSFWVGSVDVNSGPENSIREAERPPVHVVIAGRLPLLKCPLQL